jgi:hypothetical protein
MAPNRRRRGWLLIPVGAGAVACIACCAPILGVLGGIGVASTVGAVFVPALAVLALLAGAAVVMVWLRRRSAPTCAPPGPSTDLGVPSIDPAPGSAAGERR